MLDPASRYARHPDVAWRVIEDDALLVDPRTGQLYPLNPVGARIWQLLDREHSVAAVIEALAGEFDAPAEVIQEDAHAFIAQLVDANLLSVAE